MFTSRLARRTFSSVVVLLGLMLALMATPPGCLGSRNRNQGRWEY